MLIDISKKDYLKLLKIQRDELNKSVQDWIRKNLMFSLPEHIMCPNASETLLKNLTWLQEKKCELTEIEEKIELLKEM